MISSADKPLPAAKPALSDAVKEFFFEKQTRQCMVYGHSMEPFLSFGETVVIARHAGPLKKGRCYAFRTGNTLTIHRFIKYSGNGHAMFVGDSSHFIDCVPLQDVIGELSPCQTRGGVFIIRIINSVFCTFILIFNNAVAINKIRRRMVRLITGSVKKRGHGCEKKI